MPQLAFFPWMEVECDVDVGDYSLKRFKPSSLPTVDEECRVTLDSVLAPYRDAWDDPVGSAVILNRNGRGLTDDLTDEDRDDLFIFAELFAFAALAAREFFISDYFNPRLPSAHYPILHRSARRRGRGNATCSGAGFLDKGTA